MDISIFIFLLSLRISNDLDVVSYSAVSIVLVGVACVCPARKLGASLAIVFNYASINLYH